MSRAGRPWRRVRDRVIRRDGGICHLCGQPGADTADHLVPYSHNPAAELDMGNLAAAHQRCNRIRQDHPVETARAKLTTQEPTGWDW